MHNISAHFFRRQLSKTTESSMQLLKSTCLCGMNTNAEPNAMANIKNIVSVIYEVPSNLVDAKVYTILEKQVYK